MHSNPSRLGRRTWRGPLVSRAESRPLLLISLALLLALLVAGSGCSENAPTLSDCYPPGACDDIVLDPTERIFTAGGGDAEVGAALFLDNCARCHGSDGVGNEKAAGLSFRTDAWQRRLTDNQIRLVVKRGRGAQMPAFPFADSQVRDLIAHIRTLRDAAPSPGSKYGL